jgi:hypothetical protein
MIETTQVLYDITQGKYNVVSKLHITDAPAGSCPHNPEITAIFKSKNDPSISFDLYLELLFDDLTVIDCEVDKEKNIDAESVADHISNNTTFIKWLYNHAKAQVA